MSQLLVTGGSGFVGTYMCEALLQRDHAVRILDIHPPSAAMSSRVEYMSGDIRDAQVLDTALRDCDAVVHLAAAHHDFGISEATYHAVNDGGMRELCAAMERAGLGQMLFYSSCAVYGSAPEPHDESCTPAPESHYGASKLAGEHTLKAWVDGHSSRRALVIRPTVTFGPGNFANMYTLIRQIDRGVFWPVGKGQNLKSMAYVENLVDASLFLWEREAHSEYEVFNWVEKPDLSSDQIARIIYARLGKSYPSLPVPLGLALAIAKPCDLVAQATGINLPITAARIRKLAGTRTVFEAQAARDAGYVPAASLAEGIERMVDWYRAEGSRLPIVRNIPPAEPVRAA